MKIEQSVVTMNAVHAFSSECEVKLNSESSFRTVFAGVKQAGALSANDETSRESQLLLMLQALIARLLELISGNQEARMTDLREILKTQSGTVPDATSARPRRVVEMVWKRELTETLREHESTDFSSSGTIRTADGRALDFTLDLAMCRDFTCERKVTENGKVVLRDPLVINFAGKAVELSGKRFAFDLDADGESDAMFGLASGSGYLAIDRNADGRVNDGSELFGTRSGNGFADLAALDSDGNRWIDETDAAFGTLRIWERSAAGQESLSTLREKGVGALYLGMAETPFSVTDSENRTLAQIHASGIYLREDGSAGSLQQLDLAV